MIFLASASTRAWPVSVGCLLLDTSAWLKALKASAKNDAVTPSLEIAAFGIPGAVFGRLGRWNSGGDGGTLGGEGNLNSGGILGGDGNLTSGAIVGGDGNFRSDAHDDVNSENVFKEGNSSFTSGSFLLSS